MKYTSCVISPLAYNHGVVNVELRINEMNKLLFIGMLVSGIACAALYFFDMLGYSMVAAVVTLAFGIGISPCEDDFE